MIAVEIDRDAVARLRRAAQGANLPLTAIARAAAACADQLWQARRESFGTPAVSKLDPKEWT